MNNHLRGHLAQQAGQSIENWAEASFRQYLADGRACYQKNYPEIIQQGYKATGQRLGWLTRAGF